jgi:amino-acid N-acetyltransferase
VEARVTTIRAARAEDRPRVEELLAGEGLPLDGVGEHFSGFVIAEEAGALVGAAGLEVHEDCGLLRSVVVTPAAKGRGIGGELTECLLREGTRRGLRAVYLLTTTAADYFARLGFERVERDAVPTALHGSKELQGACPSSAVVMRHLEPLTPTTIAQ